MRRFKVEVTALTAEVEKLSRRCKELWSLNYNHLAEFDKILFMKDEELAALHQQSKNSTAAAAHTAHTIHLSQAGSVHHCKGKASGYDLQFED